ncbi:MAG: GIY-YIG nuclease family protein [Leeuwenhoekiella sp.]
MIYILLKTVPVSKKKKVVVQISLTGGGEDDFEAIHFNIRLTEFISKKVLETHGIIKSQMLQANPFCDVANELIEIIGSKRVGFLSNFEYRMFVSEFKTIGYNCALNFKTLDFLLKSLKISPYEANIREVANALSLENKFEFEDLSEVELLQLCYLQTSKGAGVVNIMEASNQYILDASKATVPLLQKPGVYYFKNADDEVLYVGKAKKVRTRLKTHFRNAIMKEHVMYPEISSIDVEYTGSDLIAQLLESNEIKHLSPKFNSQQVKTPAPYQIATKPNKQGVMRFVLEQKKYQDTEADKYYNRNSAKKRLRDLCKIYMLCPKFCSLERIAGGCSQSNEGKCRGVCVKKEDIETYNKRVQLAFEALQKEIDHKIIKVAGRSKVEIGFVLISNGIYQGFGFYGINDSITNFNDLESYVERHDNNYDTTRIVDTFLKKISKDQIIDLRYDLKQ